MQQRETYFSDANLITIFNPAHPAYNIVMRQVLVEHKLLPGYGYIKKNQEVLISQITSVKLKPDSTNLTVHIGNQQVYTSTSYNDVYEMMEILDDIGLFNPNNLKISCSPIEIEYNQAKHIIHPSSHPKEELLEMGLRVNLRTETKPIRDDIYRIIHNTAKSINLSIAGTSSALTRINRELHRIYMDHINSRPVDSASISPYSSDQNSDTGSSLSSTAHSDKGSEAGFSSSSTDSRDNSDQGSETSSDCGAQGPV